MSDVDDANKTISALLQIKADVESSIAKAEDWLDAFNRDHIEPAQQSLADINTQTANRLEEIDSREAELAAIEREHKGKVLDLLTQEHNLEKNEAVLKSSIKSLKEAYSRTDDELKDLEREIHVAELDLDNFDSALDAVRRDLAETTTLIDETRDSFRQEYTEALKELDSLKKQIADAKGQVEDPFKHLQERQERHAKREKDFNIIYARMKRIYAEMFPGQTLKI
jgi:chromosome segregation ATPase